MATVALRPTACVALSIWILSRLSPLHRIMVTRLKKKLQATCYLSGENCSEPYRCNDMQRVPRVEIQIAHEKSWKDKHQSAEISIIAMNFFKIYEFSTLFTWA